MSQSDLNSTHAKLTSVIWSIANNLRGRYKPAQYRKVMLPLIVLARFDAILSPHADAMKAIYDEEQKKPENQRMNEMFLGKAIASKVGMVRTQPLYNVSGFNLESLLNDADQISANIVKYLQGFSPKAKDIFDKFDFENEVQKLHDADLLYFIISEFVKEIKSAGLDLSPQHVSNLQMGYVFEDLVRRFNEQANEEAGDHFTPREVIKLMVNVIFEEDHKDLVKSGVHRSVYDPTAGTGGMLSTAEMHLKSYNDKINLQLFGQEYNPESYAICCSDLLIKDEPANNIIYGDTLGIKNSKDSGTGFVPHDGHQGKQFHYMLANPPYGVEWKAEEDFVKDEAKLGFNGRFGAGLPRINDGSLLFLQHMISKMCTAPEDGGEGSRIAVVFNGSPLFTGDAGSGESNIRRWIIENDWLETVIALPDQMFYNTGIYTYIWIVSNKKSVKRKGKVQLIDATAHYQKMRKSLGDKRNELSDDHIAEITKLYANFSHNETSQQVKNKQGDNKVCSKIFNNRDFGFLKLTVERPLRLNFQISEERIAKLDAQTDFKKVVSDAQKKKMTDAEFVAETQKRQNVIKELLTQNCTKKLWKNKEEFEKELKNLFKTLNFTVYSHPYKAILSVFSAPDASAEICFDNNGNPMPDSSLRDTELVPLPHDIQLPLPVMYDDNDGASKQRKTEQQQELSKLIALIKPHCEQYMQDEVLPHVPDAWVDYDNTKVGYEIPLNRHFYVYEPPRDLADIRADIVALEKDIMQMLGNID